MNNWQTICEHEALIADTGVCALVGDEQVAIFLSSHDNGLYAVSNYDPIGNANVLSRGIIGSVEDRLVVASPLYKQHFCLKSGECLEQDDVKLSTFDVRVESGQVQVKLSA
ncbi:nitrite reductase (NAD(P)H) small subunit [Veronia nyctiphanis]|uniref:Nitrite reductase (NAD(P)H) small subunit n=1 Tax=Veronia nyctiphanis TaxID=1278244 RepID=A0A4Q0YS47_9GAMM|nr:nitrite reductase small subunit NirD [Veronia nyctiphanis]RXJ74037.1 nitrite reductase (NAD(P)H) small subunit [Veronia nyctiphanis]